MGRSLLLLLTGACLAVLSGCSPSEPSPPPPPEVGIPATATPTSLDDCNHISIEGDPGLGAGYHYDESARYAFGGSGRLILCAHPWDEQDEEPAGGPWKMTADDAAVTLTPVSGTPATGIVELTVTVTGPADGTRTAVASEGVSFSGPNIRTDDQGWWFGPWGDGAWE